jgi:hypothetical protein
LGSEYSLGGTLRGPGVRRSRIVTPNASPLEGGFAISKLCEIVLVAESTAPGLVRQNLRRRGTTGALGRLASDVRVLGVLAHSAATVNRAGDSVRQLRNAVVAQAPDSALGRGAREGYSFIANATQRSKSCGAVRVRRASPAKGSATNPASHGPGTGFPGRVRTC